MCWRVLLHFCTCAVMLLMIYGIASIRSRFRHSCYFIYLFIFKQGCKVHPCLKKSHHLTSSHSTTAHDAFDSATDSGNGQTVKLRRAVFKCTVSVDGAQGWVQHIGSRFCFSWCQHVNVWMQSAYQRSHCSMSSSFLLKPWFKLAALQRAES